MVVHPMTRHDHTLAKEKAVATVCRVKAEEMSEY